MQTTAAPVATTVRAADACPVITDVLTAALKSNADIYSRVANPDVLVDPICYKGFAVAHTVASATNDQVSILFRFEEADQRWVAVNLGSANFCEGYTTTDVAAHLPGCQ